MLFVAVLAVGSLASSAGWAAGYSMCRWPAGDIQMQCGSGCPRGTTVISYNPGSHPRCDKGSLGAPDGIDADVDLKPGCTDVQNLKDDLGWPERGNKTKFCRKRGYDGVTNFPGQHRYKAHGGGFCFSGTRAACTKSLPVKK